MRKTLRVLVPVIIAASFGCARGADVEKVPVGSEVQLTRQDGVVVEGKLTDRDSQVVKVTQGSVKRTVARADIADVRVVDETKPAVLPPMARFREYTVPEGTSLAVRLETAVASDSSRVEDAVEATVTEPVVINRVEVIPAGSVLKGIVAAVEPSGKVKGRASITLHFTRLVARGEEMSIVAHFGHTAPATKVKDAAKIAIPAAGGAIIGAVVGGGKGAAIGTAIGAGAGTAVVLSTAGEEIRWGRGTALSLSLQRAVDVRVPIAR